MRPAEVRSSNKLQRLDCRRYQLGYMMTSSNGNIFRVTGPLCTGHKGQWRGALMFYLIWALINTYVNNREAGDLRRYRAHYDVTVMGTSWDRSPSSEFPVTCSIVKIHAQWYNDLCAGITNTVLVWGPTVLPQLSGTQLIGAQLSCRKLSTLQYRHNGRDSVSNHQPHDCSLNRLFSRRSKKTSKFCVTGLCAGNSPVPGEFPAQMASNAEKVSIWWRHLETNESTALKRKLFCHWVKGLRQRHLAGAIHTPSMITYMCNL